MDATDDPLHGEQEGRFFHGFGRKRMITSFIMQYNCLPTASLRYRP